jgi:hypothetical protein
MRTSLGPTGAEFEVRLLLDPKFASRTGSSSSSGSRDAFNKPTGLGAKAGGTSVHPIVEEIVVRIPIASGARNLSDLKPSRGAANYSPGDTAVEWRLGAKDAAVLSQGLHMGGQGVAASIRCTVVGATNEDGEQEGDVGTEMRTETWDYDEGAGRAYQSPADEKVGSNSKLETERNARKIAANRTLMPNSASVSFQVKGWLASGIRVEKLVIDSQRSKGLGAGVQPYKGVKYLTVSKDGIEVRC